MRVVVADDAVLFREGVARILAEAGFDVTGQAGDAAELMALVQHEPPAVAIIDIRMPPGHVDEGMQAAVQLRRAHPDVGLLLLSQHVETSYAVQLMTEFESGVGYLLKDRVADLQTFANDVRRVANGDCVLDPELVARLLGRKRVHDPLTALTHRERAVLELMAQGRSNLALSAELFLSPKTVEAHVRSIFTKLNLPQDAADHRRVLAVLAYLRAC
ncbi:response regulator transcription factor [Streptomyces sp. NBC_01483]|uniref:response regulator transcription factor n=1 Tax=Streptomyces sp. NBC_01483 TaxID=2903883 RepID=UPI002E33368E|nr:response regulator transcription factor [Streptomyces sp. NBC_01483]